MNDLDTLLTDMLERGGSDLHLSVGARPKTRIDGLIHPLSDQPIQANEMEAMLQAVTPEHRWRAFLESHDTDLAHEIPGKARFRMNLFRNSKGMATVLRQIPSRIASIDELGLPQALKKIANYTEGLVLVTGPTGNGKSTTLAAIIDEINESSQRQIITLEDPVEFAHQDKNSTILHREIGEHSHSFTAGLKSAMRADPDVILIGEMRSMETIRLALNCAAMGMLVFATLHTNSATKTIDRIIDAFPSDEQNQARIMLAESLRGIVSQLLCKRKDGGRIPAHEILLKHGSLPNCIRNSAHSSIRNIIDQNRSAGMVSLDVSLRKLLDDDIITMEEAYMKASDKAQFKPN
ncbi:PilT/PilU family type 4a pilus ATPase [Coraliomargarita sp. SDUM461004]|uniref:PilT/PilU family type 4a pilus ATPase n=1 Tax=Thalassobacterium sedimentorum TaxID=3041258 RepID=A0ABU1AFV6_9BACT|nr:PilT/PilU family type 4a pilus ATPase [Coraliomargarita sp. SDUM461004]MDQ8193444.1 PilT/PilU family type 4a pilus ATPase [Coraliomargarita sp. SDUM461004]